MEDSKFSKLKEKLKLALEEKNKVRKIVFGDYSEEFKEVIKKLEQLENKKIEIEDFRVIIDLLKSIQEKEIEFPEYPKVRTEDVVEGVKELREALEKKEREKATFWNTSITFFKKEQTNLSAFLKGLKLQLGDITSQIFKVRIEEQKETIRVMPVDSKGKLIKGDVSVLVPNLGILKDVNGQMINPATKEKQDEIIAALGGAGAASVGDGTQTLTTAGIPEQLSDVACTKVFIVAHESNVGTIVIGGSTVVAALVGRRGRSLFATQGDFFNVSNLNLLWIDSTASGDKVHYYTET